MLLCNDTVPDCKRGEGVAAFAAFAAGGIDLCCRRNCPLLQEKLPLHIQAGFGVDNDMSAMW